jgi:hypothetical protein
LKRLVLQSDARPASGQLTGAKIGFEDAKAQPPGRVTGLHGKLERACRNAASLRRAAPQRKRGMYGSKPLIPHPFRGEFLSRNKGLPVHCGRVHG